VSSDGAIKIVAQKLKIQGFGCILLKGVVLREQAGEYFLKIKIR